MPRISRAPRLVNDDGQSLTAGENYRIKKGFRELSRRTAVAPRAILTLSAFYAGLATATSADWHENWGHPYFFLWADEVYREQVLSWLVASGTRQADHAGKDMLRWLLYRFRVAQFRRKAPVGGDFTEHRWIWATHAEVGRDTGLSERQIRGAVDRLESRGLVVQASDGALNYVPHYRPTDDLFRACLGVTMLSDEHAVEVLSVGLRLDGQSLDDFVAHLIKAHKIMRTSFHDDLRAMVQAFAVSREPHRAVTLLDAHNRLVERAVETLDPWQGGVTSSSPPPLTNW